MTTERYKKITKDQIARRGPEPTEFQFRVMVFLSEQPNRAATSKAIGEFLYPDKVGRRSSQGGPSNVAVAAAWQLGRMKRATEWLDYGGIERRSSWTLNAEGLRVMQVRQAWDMLRSRRESAK